MLTTMSYGKAVVTTEFQDMTEIIEDGKAGFLFRSGEAQDLARAVNMALSDPDLRGRIDIGGLQLMRVVQLGYHRQSHGRPLPFALTTYSSI